MLTIQMVCVGKIKESFFKEAIQEYQKRISKYCNLSIVEVPDEKLPDKINASIIEEIREKECQKILSRMKKDSYIVCLDVNGKRYSSEEFSKRIDFIPLQYNSTITFVIGGTLGLTNEVLEMASETISFSSMTFPHQLIRVFLLEQLFRSFKISRGETYHW